MIHKHNLFRYHKTYIEADAGKKMTDVKKCSLKQYKVRATSTPKINNDTLIYSNIRPAYVRYRDRHTNTFNVAKSLRSRPVGGSK